VSSFKARNYTCRIRVRFQPGPASFPRSAKRYIVSNKCHLADAEVILKFLSEISSFTIEKATTTFLPVRSLIPHLSALRLNKLDWGINLSNLHLHGAIILA